MRLEDSELCVKQQLQDVREMVKRRFDRIEDKMDRSERETGAKLRDIFNMVQRDVSKFEDSLFNKMVQSFDMSSLKESDTVLFGRGGESLAVSKNSPIKISPLKRMRSSMNDDLNRFEKKVKLSFNRCSLQHGESSRPVDRRSRRFEKSPIRRSSGEAAMAQALAVPIECTFCSDTEHWSDQCFRHLSVKWRIDFVKSNGRCVVCLKNHSGICRPREGSITKCHHCGVEMDHNSALCTSAAHYEKLGQLTEANSHK